MKTPLIALALLLALCIPCASGPVGRELTSYRALARQNAATNGGASPAISPDGDNVAYYSTNAGQASSGAVYVIYAGTPPVPGSVPTPRKLDYEPQGSGSSLISIDPMSQSRDIDWSPDGKRLAFLGSGGGLYVADGVRGGANDTRVRPLVTDTDQSTDCVRAPRWSPDGRSIAYVRSCTGTGTSKVCVVDPESGKQTVLAADALSMLTWEQPWSPDGRQIVYAGGKGSVSLGVGIGGKTAEDTAGSPTPQKQDEAEDTQKSFVAVVPVAGGDARKLPCAAGGMRPSWSPKGDRIAFVGPGEYRVKLTTGDDVIGHTLAIWTTDVSGKAKKIVEEPAKPTAKECASYDAAVVSAMRDGFLEQYGSQLTSRQLDRLKSGAMTAKEMGDISNAITKQQTGIDLESAAKKAPGDPEVAKAFQSARQYMTKALYQSCMPMMYTMVLPDLAAIWSPDGERIAIIRTAILASAEGCLLVKDLKTGETRTLFSEACIDCFAWADGGKKAALQARRLMSNKSTLGELNEDPDLADPEVWILEPR